MPEDKELKEELAKKAGGRKKVDSPQTPILKTAVPEPGAGSPTIRLLRADEIECRVSTINEKGLSLLLFKDARVDQRILDETFTPFGWRRTHQCIDGKLYCTVEVWDSAKGQWVAKQDVGTESYSEKEKGQASDSFKRACLNWGVGRELYTICPLPFTMDRAEISRRALLAIACTRNLSFVKKRLSFLSIFTNPAGIQIKGAVYSSLPTPQLKQARLKESDACPFSFSE